MYDLYIQSRLHLSSMKNTQKKSTNTKVVSHVNQTLRCDYSWYFSTEEKTKERKGNGQWDKTRPTWKAEEAVPKTKPLGKLALLISDKHIWILQTTATTSATKAMPLLTIVAAQWICGGERERERSDKSLNFSTDGDCRLIWIYLYKTEREWSSSERM